MLWNHKQYEILIDISDANVHWNVMLGMFTCIGTNMPCGRAWYNLFIKKTSRTLVIEEFSNLFHWRKDLHISNTMEWHAFILWMCETNCIMKRQLMSRVHTIGGIVIYVVSGLFSWIYVDSQIEVNNIWSRNNVFFVRKKLNRVSQSFDREKEGEGIKRAHHKASTESLHYYSRKTKIEIRNYLKICWPRQILGTKLSCLGCANGRHKFKH